MHLGDRLKSERLRLQLSQKSMAEAADTSTRSQISYETGQVKSLPSQYLARVAPFGVDVMYVLTGERVENVATTPNELAFLRLARAMPSKEVADAARQALVGILASHGIKLDQSS